MSTKPYVLHPPSPITSSPNDSSDPGPPQHKSTQSLCQHPTTKPHIPPRPFHATATFTIHIQPSLPTAREVFAWLTFSEEEVNEEGDEGAAEDVVEESPEGFEIENCGGDAEEEGR